MRERLRERGKICKNHKDEKGHTFNSDGSKVLGSASNISGHTFVDSALLQGNGLNGHPVDVLLLDEFLLQG